MKQSKRFLSLLLALCLMASMIPVTARAAENGTCGENLTWKLSDDGVLTISGTGPMTYYSATAPWYVSRSSIKRVVLKNGVTSIDFYAFNDCTNLTKVTIPESVTLIDTGAFYGCTKLASVTIPDSVTSIGNSAFLNCSSLASVNIPDGITSISSYTFYGCTSLTKITIPNSVTTIGSGAFCGCTDLTSVVIGKSVESIDSFSFSGTSLDKVTIPASVTFIGTDVFYSCASLERFYVASQNTSYCNDSYGVLFNKAKTTLIQMPCAYEGHYSIPSSVTSIGDSAFDGCNGLTSISIPNSVTSIGDFSFCNFNLTNITIPDSVTSIGKYAFCNSNGLTSVAIPASVTSIGEYAFAYSTSLNKIFFRGNAPSIGDYAFNENENITAYYPSGNSTWTSKVKQDYGGNITWIPYEKVKLKSPQVTLTNVASSGKIKISWNKVDGADKYEVYRNTAKNGTYSLIKTTTDTSIINTSAKAGKTYYYIVTAIDEKSGAYAHSEVKSRTCDLPRPEVTISNVASTGKIKVSWKAVEGAVKYEVYRSTSKDGTYSLLKTTTGTSFTNTSTTAGKTYYYKVKAIASNSAANSAYSVIESRTCDLARPEVTLSNVASSGKIKVSWKKIDGAVKYEVYRATSKDGTYSLIKTTTGTSFTNTSTTAGKTYYYKVKAIASNSAANSAYSEIESRTCDLARPEVSITRSSGKPKVSWDKVTGAVEYKVYRATSKSGTYSLVKTTTSLSYKNTGATAGKTYYYKVVAVHSKNAANSAYSSIVSIKSK